MKITWNGLLNFFSANTIIIKILKYGGIPYPYFPFIAFGHYN